MRTFVTLPVLALLLGFGCIPLCGQDAGIEWPDQPSASPAVAELLRGSEALSSEFDAGAYEKTWVAELAVRQAADGWWRPGPGEDLVLAAPGSLLRSPRDRLVARTAASLLCLLAAGFDHRSRNQYQKFVAAGMTALSEAVDADPGLGCRSPAAHALAAMALAEATAMTNDPELRPRAERCCAALIGRATRDDSGSIRGWSLDDPLWLHTETNTLCLMALKSGKAGDIVTGEVLPELAEALRQVAASLPSDGRADQPWPAEVHLYGRRARGEASSAAAAAAMFLGYENRDPLVTALTHRVLAQEVEAAQAGFPAGGSLQAWLARLACYLVGGELSEGQLHILHARLAQTETPQPAAAPLMHAAAWAGDQHLERCIRSLAASIRIRLPPAP